MKNLVRNRYGVYHYCCVIPANIKSKIKQQQIRRSLRTKDRVLAIIMAREFREVTQWIFKRIEYHDMKWNEVKKIMDKTADDLFRKYVERVDEVGFLFRDENTLDSVMPAAKTFLFNDSEMYHTDGIPVTNEDELTVGYDPVYTSREEYERLVDTKKEITQLVDGILEANSIDLSKGSPEYKQFCRQTLEMLHRLDKQKAEYRQQVIHGLPQTIFHQPPTVLHGTPSPSISLRELIEKYIHHKDVIEKTWAAKTKKDNSEILYRILEMFEMVVGEPNPAINALNREHARSMKEVLALIPSNLKKKAKFINRPLKDIIDDSRKGLVKEDERITSVTFNNYATLITAIFSYAKSEGFIHENYFDNMRVPKEKRTKKRQPFTESELTKFFSTDLYTKKDVPLKWIWRIWVPAIALYTAARTEEICQLQLDDIYKVDNVLCFHIRERKNPKTGDIITRVKNPQSERIIPVHPNLKTIGLERYIQFLKREKETQLFPTLKNFNTKGEYKKYHTDVSKFFNENSGSRRSYIKRCGITDKNKVLYCFRHTVETLLINHPSKIDHDIIDTIIGHEIKSTGRRHYGSYNAKTLYDVVCNIDYPGAVFPWDQPGYDKVLFEWEK